MLRRTNDEFGITLAGNPMTKGAIELINKVAHEVHVARVGAEHVDP